MPFSFLHALSALFQPLAPAFVLGVALFSLAAYYAPSLRPAPPAANRAPLATLAMYAAYAAFLTLAAAGFLGQGGAATLLNALGIPLLMAGIAIHAQALSDLGANWSPHVALQKRHALVTTGWYARVRHPVYLAALSFYAGLAVLLASPHSLAGFLLLVAYWLYRIRVEERVLRSRFKTAYAAYARRTPNALLPLPA